MEIQHRYVLSFYLLKVSHTELFPVSNVLLGIDWAGVLVERVSGMRLNEYFKKK